MSNEKNQFKENGAYKTIAVDPEIQLFNMQQDRIKEEREFQLSEAKKYADEQDARADKSHKQQCRIIALDKAHKHDETTTTDEMLFDADKIYEWLVK